MLSEWSNFEIELGNITTYEFLCTNTFKNQEIFEFLKFCLCDISNSFSKAIDRSHSTPFKKAEFEHQDNAWIFSASVHSPFKKKKEKKNYLDNLVFSAFSVL